MMLYCTLRLADYHTFLDVFGPIESFLDVGVDQTEALISLDMKNYLET